MRNALSVLLALVFLCALSAAAAQVAGKMLPTEWSLSAPSDLVVPTGTLPVSATLDSAGQHLVVVEDGQAGAAVRIFDAATLAQQRVVPLDGADGAVLPDARGSGFWLGTGAQDKLVHVDASNGNIDRTIALPAGFWPAAIARSPDGRMLAVSGDLAGSVVLIDEASGTIRATVKTGHHPAGLAFGKVGNTLYVANRGEANVSAVDLEPLYPTVRATIPVGRHPVALLLSKDGTRLYVSESDEDAVGVYDTGSERRIADINVGLYGGKVFGASPTALALSADGTRLYVACSAAAAIAVILPEPTGGRVLGAIPTGWYPTGLALERSGRALDVVDGKGEGSPANPQFNPFGPSESRHGYVAAITLGSLRRIPIPDYAAEYAGLTTVRANGGPFLSAAIENDDVRDHGPPSDDPGRAIVRAGGPIHHVIYIVKENRTYDQVLGDLPGANGDPSLALFDAKVTPNEHALARRFGIFDNTFADAEVSADGHNWSMAAFANDYVEKMWPPNYGGRRPIYDFEDGAEASVPHNAFLWNAAARAHVTLRNYGEFVSDPEKPGAPVISHMPDLAAFTDPRFVGFDTTYRDEAREAEWAREFAGYVKAGNLPALEIARLPNDHTAGTRPGARTPTAMVAENDLALGRLVSAVSHSQYWKDTAIFVVEDDAQNGPDHVDAQRMPVYVISPFAKGGVQHAHYSTAGIVRTIELILGIPPMSAYDASARPLYAAFTPRPNERTYDVLPEGVDLEAKNTATSYRARDSAKLDFTHEDGVPDAILNDIVWHAVRGAASTPPPYGEFSN